MLEQDMSRTVKYLPASERIAREREREALHRQLQREDRIQGAEERVAEQAGRRRDDEEKERDHQRLALALLDDPRAAITRADGSFLDPQAARARRWTKGAHPESPVYVTEEWGQVDSGGLEVQEGQEEEDEEDGEDDGAEDSGVDQLADLGAPSAGTGRPKPALSRMSVASSSTSSASSSPSTSSPTSEPATNSKFLKPRAVTASPKKFMQAAAFGDDFADDLEEIGTAERSKEDKATVAASQFLRGSGPSTPTSTSRIAPEGFGYDDNDDATLDFVESPKKSFSVLVSADFGAGTSESPAALARSAASPSGHDQVRQEGGRELMNSLEVPTSTKDLSLFDSDFSASEDPSVASSDET
jgi:hypothetical protein